MIQDKSYHVTAILGSLRPGNRTRHALELMLACLRRDPELSLDLIDPATMTLALPGDYNAPLVAEELMTRVAMADALVLATPEYHGSYSSVIKAIIDNLGYPSAMADKPVVLLGVASGKIGAVKAIEHLRGVCAHVGAIVLPNPVSIAQVHEVFTDQGICTHPEIAGLIEHTADYLLGYLRGRPPHEPSLQEVVRQRGD